MITLRISEDRIYNQLQIKCPSCAQKSVYSLSDGQVDALFDGESVKLFCPKCSEGFNLEMEY